MKSSRDKIRYQALSDISAFVIIKFLQVLQIQENYCMSDTEPIIASVLTEVFRSIPGTPEKHTNSGTLVCYSASKVYVHVSQP
jgi:hypothetical protein